MELIKFWDDTPCNINHTNEKDINKKFFNDIMQKKYFVEKHIPSFSEFNKYKGKKVLEIGCGIGTAMQSFIEAGSLYTGIDFSPYSIKLSEKRSEIFDLNANLTCVDVLDYKTEEKFDLIYSFGVLHHIIEIEKVIEKIYDMLKIGGEFKLMLYATNSWKKFKINDDLDRYESVEHVPYVKTYSNEEILKLLKKFKNINITQTHIFPYKIKEYKQNIFVKEEYFEKMDQKMFECLEKNLGWHLCITCNK